MGQAIRLPQPWCYTLLFCRAAPWHTDSTPVPVLAGAIPAAFALTTATGYLIIIVHNNFSSMFKNVGGFGGVLSVPVPVSLPGALGSPLPCRCTDALRHFQLAKMWKQDDTTRPSGDWPRYYSVGRLIMILGANYNNICVFHFDFSLCSNSELASPPLPWHLPMAAPPPPARAGPGRGEQESGGGGRGVE